jgi:hypothetical protein
MPAKPSASSTHTIAVTVVGSALGDDLREIKQHPPLSGEAVELLF